jgi:hypothetical protein
MASSVDDLISGLRGHDDTPDPQPEPRDPEPQPEPREPAPQDPQPPREPTPAPVPYARFQEQNHTLRATQAELAQLRDEIAKLRAQPKPAEAENKVSYETDPDAYLKSRQDQIDSEVKEMRAWKEAQAAQAAAAERINQYQNWHRSQIEEFKATQPDVLDAYRYISDSLKRTLGYAASPGEIGQYIEQWEFAAVNNAIAVGKNPAAHLYDIATKMGYKAQSSGDEGKERLKAQTPSLGAQRSAESAAPAQDKSLKGFITDLQRDAGYRR